MIKFIPSFFYTNIYIKRGERKKQRVSKYRTIVIFIIRKGCAILTTIRNNQILTTSL